MNILQLLMVIFWKKTGDSYTFQKLSIALNKSSISINAKDFHTYNNFFQTIIQANVIALSMYKLQYTSYRDFAI